MAAMIRLHNTLSGRLEDFVPIESGSVKLYTCGPTVYDFPHIGNWRSYVFEDLLKRLFSVPGIPGPPRHEHHGRRRQDDPRGQREGRRARGLHEAVHRGLRPGPRRPGHPARRHLSPGDGTHPGDGRAHRNPSGKGFRLPEGRLDLLRHRQVPRVRAPVQDQPGGPPARHPCRRRRIREGERPRLRPLEGAEGRRARLGDPDRSGPAGLAHRMLGHELQVPRPDLRHPLRRRRQHLSPPRERDRPVRGGQRRQVRQLLGPRPSPGRRRREDVQVEGQLLPR